MAGIEGDGPLAAALVGTTKQGTVTLQPVPSSSSSDDTGPVSVYIPGLKKSLGQPVPVVLAAASAAPGTEGLRCVSVGSGCGWPCAACRLKPHQHLHALSSGCAQAASQRR